MGWMRRLFDFGNEIEDTDKIGRIALEDGLIAKGLGDMGFTDSGIPDEDKILRHIDPIGVFKSQEFLSGHLGIKMPIQLIKGTHLIFGDSATSHEPHLAVVLALLELKL